MRATDEIGLVVVSRKGRRTYTRAWERWDRREQGYDSRPFAGVVTAQSFSEGRCRQAPPSRELLIKALPKLHPVISLLHLHRQPPTANHATTTDSAVCRRPQSVSTRCHRGSQAKRVSFLFALSIQWLAEGQAQDGDDDNDDDACNATQPIHRDTDRHIHTNTNIRSTF